MQTQDFFSKKMSQKSEFCNKMYLYKMYVFHELLEKVQFTNNFFKCSYFFSSLLLKYRNVTFFTNTYHYYQILCIRLILSINEKTEFGERQHSYKTYYTHHHTE